MEWALCIAIHALGFVGTHQPFTIDLNPRPVCNHGATEFGGGLKRLDPGTVNLPIFVGPCPTCAKWQPNLITVWFPRQKR